MSERGRASSDAILERLTGLPPKLIDLSLDRTWRLLAALGHPERSLPPVFHIAGTNGKGSVAAYLRACLEAGGHAVHSYTSPHLVRFHERTRLAARPHSKLIEEPALAALLDECERANDGQPITFFEITTCAALLAFSRAPADALVLEVGMGGRLDTTNVVARPAVSIITPVDLDHQAFLGNTIALIATEKAVVGPQPDEARIAIEMAAEKTGTPLFIHGQDFSAHEEAGALVYQDEAGLLDLPLPRLAGRHQIDNAGVAICALRRSGILPLDRAAIAEGLTHADWPARLQRLTRGPLVDTMPGDSDLWLDGGHNPAAGRAVAETMADIDARDPKPLILVAGMLDTKDAAGFFAPFAGLATHVETVTIPDAPASLPADALAEAARSVGLDATPFVKFAVTDNGVLGISSSDGRTLGGLRAGAANVYLAGHILRDHA